MWSFADFGVGLYTWVNILALVLLSPVAIRLMKDYDRRGCRPPSTPSSRRSGRPSWRSPCSCSPSPPCSRSRSTPRPTSRT
ncbi:hypothetical protein D9C01_12565 [Corynebacterium diphtheriae]|nr:hypothetical protein D9C01_12565 [Corynebacterium diphtheriae]